MFCCEGEVTKNELGYFEIGKDRLLVHVLYKEENIDERKCSKLTLVTLNSDDEDYKSSQTIQNHLRLPVTFDLPMLGVSIEKQEDGQAKLKVISVKFVAEGLVETDEIVETTPKLRYRLIRSALTEEEIEMIEKGSSEDLLTFEYVNEDTLEEGKKKLNRLLSTALDYHAAVDSGKD